MQGIPFNQQNLTIEGSNASGTSTVFKIDGGGFLSCLITLADTNSADGEFYFELSDTETGTYERFTVPVVSKVAGTALATEPLQLDKPGTRWARVAWVRTSGGHADEDITLAISNWAA